MVGFDFCKYIGQSANGFLDQEGSDVPKDSSRAGPRRKKKKACLDLGLGLNLIRDCSNSNFLKWNRGEGAGLVALTGALC